MLQEDGKQKNVANYHIIENSFQESHDEVTNILDRLVGANMNVRLIVADALFGLDKMPWDSKEKMWKKKEFKDVLNFTKVRK